MELLTTLIPVMIVIAFGAVAACAMRGCDFNCCKS